MLDKKNKRYKTNIKKKIKDTLQQQALRHFHVYPKIDLS